MAQIEINLAEPFERVLTRIESLPCRGLDTGNDGSADDELRQAIRGLYEAANGRQVETPIGWIPIAPPVAAFLKARPFYVESQIDLLIEAATRIISGPPHPDNEINIVECADRADAPRQRSQAALNRTDSQASAPAAAGVPVFFSADARP